ncbi:MAG: hypothetical protein CMB24_01765 [Euryarchaeota archaeon]|nr:hypothetical protein [Euryarchaeota archaeon]|tara:strand:+ start:3024 stop:3272 length:249 start_codon:yes stop_codon:yes gene_type:complete
MRLAGNGSINDANEYDLDEDDKRFAGDDHFDIFLETVENLRSKGYSEEGAFNVAERMTLGKEPMAKKSTRFAKIYDDSSVDD